MRFDFATELRLTSLQRQLFRASAVRWPMYLPSGQLDEFCTTYDPLVGRALRLLSEQLRLVPGEMLGWKSFLPT